MNTTGSELDLSASSWWARHRLRYNAFLLLAGAVSAISLFVVWWLFESRLPCLEITGFSLVFGGMLFLVGLGLANLCYFLGPLSERLLHPKNVPAFRRRTFALGVCFSVAIIFFPVVGNLVSAAFGPAAGGQCG